MVPGCNSTQSSHFEGPVAAHVGFHLQSDADEAIPEVGCITKDPRRRCHTLRASALHEEALPLVEVKWPKESRAWPGGNYALKTGKGWSMQSEKGLNSNS